MFEEEEDLATVPRRTGLLVGRRRIGSCMFGRTGPCMYRTGPVLAEGEDAEGEEAESKSICSWELLVEDSEGELLALSPILSLI